MLPNIDNTNQNISISPPGGGAPARRGETDFASKAINPKAADSYKSRPNAGESVFDASRDIAAEKLAESARNGKRKEAKANNDRDQVEINLTLSPEERDAFNTALNREEKPLSLSTEEKATLKKASERLSKFIEDAVSKSGERRDRVEKAMTEWYSRISKGELKSPTDLIQLLHSAASGQLDEMWK